MSNLIEYYKQAELAFAAYATLELGTPSIDELKRDAIGMSATQAQKFAAAWTVIDQYAGQSNQPKGSETFGFLN